jgi:hypothetical protein
MKTAAIVALLAVALVVSNCGTGTPTKTIENTTGGNWEAKLIGGTGPASQLNFVIQFTVTNINGTTEPLNPTGFSFINSQSQSGSCFPTGFGYNGTLTITVPTTNQVQGTMTINVNAINGGTAVLALDGTNVYGTANGSPGTIGTLTNGVVTGTWTLTGPCVGSGSQQTGTFIMCQGAATCTAPT